MSTHLSISIVEDNAEERALFAAIVDGAERMKCVSQHPNPAHAFKHLAKVKPDVVLVDVVMPCATGMECVRQIKSVLPEAVFVMLTKHEEQDYIFESLQAGASGYLIKSKARVELPELIRRAHRGEMVLTPEIARRVLGHFRKEDSFMTPTLLTPREQEILRLVAQGWKSKEIAARLNCSPHTVDRHVQHACEKLQVSGRVAAAAKFLRK